jgi:tyrosine-protein kinase Etk/Wzc
MNEVRNELLLPAARIPALAHDGAAAAGPAPEWGPTPYRKYADIVRAHKLAIALATVSCGFAGYLAAHLRPPVYQASMLVQVDDTPAPTERLLGEAAAERDLRAATAPELEVLRSRRVVARAVDELYLFIDARPRYLPLVGRWLAARSTELSGPGLPGMPGLPGYVWGAESITAPRFEVPSSLTGRPFVLTAGPGRSYILANDRLGVRLAGRVGEPAHWVTPHGEVALTVGSLHARPGAQFLVQRSARLDSIEGLQRSLRIEEQGKQSGVIRVSLEGSDPEQLALTLNEIGLQYILQNEERRSASAQKALAFLERELPAMKQSVEDAESDYHLARKRLGSVDLGGEAGELLRQAGAVQARLADLTQKRTELATRYGEGHPMMAAIAPQIGELNGELAALRARAGRLPQVEQDIVRLSRDVKVGTEVYTAALSGTRQLRLAAANRSGNARLLDPAETPVRPVDAQPQLFAAAAALLGMLLSILGACMRSRWQPRVDTPEVLERELGLAVAVAIPHSAAQWYSGAALLQLASPDDGAIESLRRLRALLQRALTDAEQRIVVIAGARPGVGSSFVAANLAAVLAAAGKRVLLVDADLRGGHLHRTFAEPRAPGLADCLAGQLDPQDVVRMEVAPHLDLLTTGTLPSHPGELLAQNRLRELLRSASLCYDYVVVDTAPVLTASDCLAVAPLGALTLAVARSGVTGAADIGDACRQLRQAGAQLAGVVVNGRRGR